MRVNKSPVKKKMSEQKKPKTFKKIVCLTCSRALRAYLLTCQSTLRAYVLKW